MACCSGWEVRQWGESKRRMAYTQVSPVTHSFHPDLSGLHFSSSYLSSFVHNLILNLMIVSGLGLKPFLVVYVLFVCIHLL